MKIFFLHGMGGGAEDANLLRASIPLETPIIPFGLSFNATAEAIAASLGQESAPFLLVGYSMGGRLALRAASTLGNKLAGLVLVSTGLGDSNEVSRGQRRASDDRWAALAEESPEVFWEKWYGQELFSSFRALPESTRAAWMKNRLSQNIEHLSAQFRTLGPGHHGDLLPELKTLEAMPISVLYIAGERDKKYAELARQLALSGTTTELLPGGHVLPLEAPAELAQSLERFRSSLRRK